MLRIKTNIWHNSEAGFTLIELIIVIAVTGLILGGIIVSIFQLRGGQQQVKDTNLAVSNLQNIGYWINRDVLPAQAISTDSPPEPLLNIAYTQHWIGDFEYHERYEINYLYDDVSKSISRQENKEFTYYDDHGDLISSNSTSIQKIANNITAINAGVSGNNIVEIAAVAEVGEHTTAQTFIFRPRIEE
jgi:prepilin-type N-terminal cleavage/methylation domain-containing protein